MNDCKKDAGSDDIVVAYGNENFVLTMKEINDDGSTHMRLVVRLSERVRMVMWDEYKSQRPARSVNK